MNSSSIRLYLRAFVSEDQLLLNTELQWQFCLGRNDFPSSLQKTSRFECLHTEKSQITSEKTLCAGHIIPILNWVTIENQMQWETFEDGRWKNPIKKYTLIVLFAHMLTWQPGTEDVSFLSCEITSCAMCYTGKLSFSGAFVCQLQDKGQCTCWSTFQHIIVLIPRPLA